MLYLIPNVFSDDQQSRLLLPEGLPELLRSLDGLIVESERSGRRFLVKLLQGDDFSRLCPCYLLNEHSDQSCYEELCSLIMKGARLGLVSDAGMPCIADPGHLLVAMLRARGETGICVIPGPCSIIMALVSSGLPGQRFAFHGYLPKESSVRCAEIRALEKQEGITHICIETPYRNNALLKDLLAVLHKKTQLAVASHLSYADEKVIVAPVSEWHKKERIIEEQPSIFLWHKN